MNKIESLSKLGGNITITVTISDLKEFAEYILSQAASIQAHQSKNTKEELPLRGIRQLANFLMISTATAQRMKDEGTIPYYKIGKRIFFDRKAVMAAINLKQNLDQDL
ncbi:MAG: helix-turn-helix domain-containing protein [Synergistaceae bacterium]|jgi:excisionase family DNA binding protein|nr:helix-turn-helix domain-containing protein [Synergistaceae bacterium]